MEALILLRCKAKSQYLGNSDDFSSNSILTFQNLRKVKAMFTSKHNKEHLGDSKVN